MKTKNFKVKWEHSTYVPDRFLPYGVRELYKNNGVLTYKRLEREQTVCTIIKPYMDHSITVAHGVTKRYYKDIPNRRLGNKVAFKRAVDQISDKSLRTELWDAYKQLSVKCINC